MTLLLEQLTNKAAQTAGHATSPTENQTAAPTAADEDALVM